MHSHASSAVLPSGATAPFVHWAHSELPVTDLKVSSAHSVHGPPSGPVHPALQEQAAAATLAAGE